jgi:hypothetical protein
MTDTIRANPAGPYSAMKMRRMFPLVARDPANPNGTRCTTTMYRLGNDDYLKSYDRAPKTVELLLSRLIFSAISAARTRWKLSRGAGPGPGQQIAATGVARA